VGEAAVAGASHAARTVGHETISVVIDYLVPIGFGVVGFGAGPSLLGGRAISNAVYNAVGGQTPANTSNRAGGAVMAVLSAGIGYAFWRMGHGDGWILKIVGKAVGAFFLGAAANYLIFCVLAGQNPPTGGLDAMFSWFGSVTGAN
jgi:hypothetical protein